MTKRKLLATKMTTENVSVQTRLHCDLVFNYAIQFITYLLTEKLTYWYFLTDISKTLQLF